MAPGPARALRAEWAGPARIGPLRLHGGNASVVFRIGVLGLFTVHGRFEAVEGELTFDEAHLGHTALRARVPVASLRTGNRFRDAHLRSRAWLDAERHPFIGLEAHAVERGTHDLLVHGTASVRGVDAPVQLSCVTRLRAGAPMELVGALEVARETFGVGPPPRRLAPWNPRAYLVEDAIHVELRLTLER